MACSIEKNKVGKIVTVKDQSGNNSKLFQQILNIPTLSLNEAIETYKNIYSDQLKNKIQFQKAFHGGKTNISKFSTDFIGTGNKSMFGGWGLYFTLNESRAKGYAEQLAKQKIKIGEYEIIKNNYSNRFETLKEIIDTKKSRLSIVKDLLSKVNELKEKYNSVRDLYFNGDFNTFYNKYAEAEQTPNSEESKKIIEEYEKLDRRSELTLTSIRQEIRELRDLAKKIIKNGAEFEKENSYLYEVSLPDSLNLFDFDNKVEEEQYNAILNQAIKENSPFVEAIKSNIGKKGRDFYFNVAQYSNTTSEKELSLLMLRAGIDGNTMQSDGFNTDIILFNGDSIAIENQIKFQILGEKGAQNLDQAEEVTYRMDNLLVAREMEKAGKTPQEIRLATGWEKNLVDSKWRYEILDGIESNIQIEFNKKNGSFTNTNIATVLLPELYDNQELYNAYPTLKKIPVIFYNDTSFFGNLNGFTWQGKLFLNAKYFIDEQNKYRRDLSDNEGRFTLQHEIQHILQNIEGFDRGTSAKTQEKKIKESLDYIRDNKGKTRNSYDEFLKNYLSKDVNFFNRLLLKTLPTDKVASILAQKFYLLKAGEVEARNVQLRANLTAQERLEKPLFETQQVPYEKQLVDVSEKDKNFIMANASLPQNKTEKQQIQEQLIKTGVAKAVYNLNSEEIEVKLIEFGEENVNKNTSGFTYNGNIYLNSEKQVEDTLLHEYNHIFRDWLRENRPEVHKKGLSLIEAELKLGEKSEIKDIFSYVKATQPNLTGEAFLEESLVQMLGVRGIELINEVKGKKGGVLEFFAEIWAQIKEMLGLENYSDQEIMNINLGEYVRATNVSLLKGEPIFTGNQGEANFNRWKGNNELVEGSEIQDIKTGQPIVAKVYHGTTNEFYEFDSKVKGNVEGHLGKVNYFTSDYNDANDNYLSDGADITGRIDRRQDEIEDELFKYFDKNEEALNFQEIVDDFNIIEEDIEILYPSGQPEFIQAEEISRFLAEKELKGIEEKVLEVYVKLNNPVVLGNGATWFDALEIDNTYLQEATQEIAEEYSITEQEAKDEYEWEIKDRAIEKQGDGNKVIEALERALDNNGYESSKAFDILGDNYYETEIDLNKIEQDLRKAELYDNYEGEIASSQVIADFFKNLGFDGIVLTDVSQRFKGMRLSKSTSHIHVFDEFNNQIKLSDGSNVDFGETSDIRFQNAAGITKAEAIKRNNGNPLNLAPNGKPSILYQSYLDLGYSVEEVERLTAQTFSDSFREWFGDSLVLDENRQPKLMYHGTGLEDWSEYDLTSDKENNSRNGGSWGKGIYLTTNSEEAKKYSKNGRVLTFFAKSVSPKKNNTPLKKADKKTIELAKELVKKEIEKSDYPDKEYAIKNSLFDLEYDLKKGKIPYLSGFITGDIYRQIMMSMGYDSVQDGASHLVLYDANQIKSATENIGTFDSGSNDIRYQVIGERGASKVEQYQNSLNQAKELDKQGVSTSEIEQQTGWYKNSQNQWKKFADDYVEQLSFKPNYLKNINKEVFVEDILNDNIILQAYPEIKNLKVVFYDQTNKNIPEQAIGADGFLRAEDREGISTMFIKTGEEQGEMDKITFSHELNHYIQRVEGFAKGGNDETTILLGMSVAKVRRGNGTIKEQLQNSLKRSDLTKEDRKIIEEGIKYLDSNNKEEFAFIQYQRLQGEIDSRAVEDAVKYNKIGKTYSEIVEDVLKKDNISQEDIIHIFGVERLLESRNQPQTQVIEPSPNFNGYTTYKEAVKNTPLNEKIKIQIDDVVLAEVSPDGAINDLIRQGIIEDRRELEPNGNITYKTSGNTLAMKIINANIAKQVLGGKVNKSGDIRTEQKQEVTFSDSFEENKKEFGNSTALSILASDALSNNTPAFGVGRIITEEIEIPSENVLMSKLKNLLNQLGIKSMNLDAWEKRFGQKANSNALADIANRIVAFADGQFNQDTLSEETSHFIIEALDQEKIAPLLAVVHKTDEWKQYSQIYMERYKDEAIVRKEVLGKVLKNALQERVQKQETLQGQSVVDRIADLFVNFIESIRNLFTDNYRQQLKKFTDEVYDKLMAEELFDELRPEQFDGNKLVMFQTQVNDTVAQSIEKLLKQVGVIDRKLNSAQKESLQKINDDLDLQDEASQLHAVSGLASVLKKHITYLNTRGKKQGFLSTEESFVYNTTEDIGKALQAILPKLEVSKLKKYKEQAIASAKEALASLSELTSNLNQEKEDRFEEIVADLAERNGLSQQQQDILLKEIRTQSRDTNVLEAWFGGVIHAQNPILNMLAKRLSRMNKEINILSSQGFNKFFSDMSEIGYKSEEVAKLMKNWAKGNYLFSPYDFVAEEKESNKIRLEVIKSIAPDVYDKYFKELKTEDKVLEDFTKNTDTWYADLSQEQNSNYRFLSNEAIKKAGLRIDALNPSEREKFDDAMEKLNLSLRTKKFIQEFKDKKNKVFRESKLNSGFSEEDLQQLQEINADFQVLFDIYDVDGNIKDGLSIDKDNIVTSTVSKDSLNEDTRTALELNQYREALKELYSGKDRNVFEGFFNQLDEVRNSTNDLKQREIKAENFIRLNTRVFYTEDFWKQSDKGETVVDKLLEQGSEEADKVAGDIKKFNIKLRNILKRNKMYNRPSQIDYDIVSAADESEIKDLVEKLETKFREAKTFLTKEESKDIERKFQSVTNDSYKNELTNRGIREKNNNLTNEELREKIDFITKHVTYSSKQAISRMIDKINSYNETRDVPKGLYISKEELLADRNKAIIEYAESKLMPYFKTLQSTQEGADTAEADLVREMVDAKSTQELEAIYERYKKDFFLDASPSFIFEDADTSNRLNKEYKKRLEENEPLLSDKFLNKDFFNYFGIDIKQGFSVNTAVATKNKKEFEAWKLTVAFQEESLELNKVKGKHNKYLLPQYRRGTFARAQQIATGLSKEKIKEAFNDAFTYREDDPAMGQTVDGEIAQLYQKNSLIIPKTGLRKIEDTETTDELLYSYMLMRKEAVKFDRRVDTWADVEAMEHYIKGKTYGDKTGEATTTYKKFNDFKRYNIYGQRETFAWETDMYGLLSKKKNLAPVINSFQNYVRNNNLAYAVLTPLTSFLQGTTNFFVEHTVGDRINREAARLAAREVPKLMTEATSEFFNVTKKAKLNLLLQFMGQDNPSEAFDNSNYGKALRGASIYKSGYLTHYIGDVPIQAQTLLTVLHDYRIVNGDITDYYSWRRKNRSLTEKGAKAQWKTYQDDVMYKHIVPNKDGSMEVSQTVKNIDGWENKVQQMRDRLTIAKQDIDNQISEGDKGMVQRHAMLSWTTLHKGWLVSSMTKRFKAQHLNLHNNMMEEGTYRGTAKFVVSFIKDLKKKGLKNAFKDNFRGYDGGYRLENNTVYDDKGAILKTFDNQKDAEDYYEELKFDFAKMRQISVARASLDFLVTSALAAAGILLSKMADSDDDDYVKEFIAYTTYRLASEVTSQSFAIPAQAYAFLESPTVGMSQLQNSLDVLDVFDSDEITRGTYRGYTKSQAWFIKAIPGIKETGKLYNMDRTRQSFEFFNEKNLKFTVTGQMMLED